MLVDRTDRLNTLRRNYNAFAAKSKKGPYRRIYINEHGLTMLEELKAANPTFSYDELVAHALSVALDYMPVIPDSETDETTLARVQDILAIHGHTVDSWCQYHGLAVAEFRRRCATIDKQFNTFGPGKNNEKGISIKGSRFDILFREEFSLNLSRLLSHDVIIAEEGGEDA